MDYTLLDSGHGQKLERFGKYILIRPCSQAVWKPELSEREWQSAHARFSREGNAGWEMSTPLPESWVISLKKIQLQLRPTDFGHLGVFPEHAHFWPWISETIAARSDRPKVLNLFAYSGGATMAAAMHGAEVCHLDASKGMVSWARENAASNHLEGAPIRWIVDDAIKYLTRAVRRMERYDAILLDPPTFGRGKSLEIFKIERDLPLILKHCVALLSDRPLFILLTCHTPGFTPLVLQQLLRQATQHIGGHINAGEMVNEGQILSLPAGTYAKWLYPCY